MELPKIDKALVKKYLEGKANSKEQNLIRRYLQHPGAQSLFDEAWNELDGDPAHLAEAATGRPSKKILDWKAQMLKRITQHTPKAPTYPGRQPAIYKYAAIWLLMILGAAGYGIYKYTARQQAETIAMLESHNPKGKRTIISLSDNSKVWLGPGSTLRYPEKFGDSIRELSLTGEAFFQVSKNLKKPFIIRTGQIVTRVLGTSFKVEAFANSPVVVAVNTGKVRVNRNIKGESHSLAVLTPGQKVTWYPDTQVGEKGSVDTQDIAGWKNGKLVFNETALESITPVLERWYDVSISIDDRKIKHLHLNITLENNLSIKQVMDVFSATGHFNYKIKDKSIVITK